MRIKLPESEKIFERVYTSQEDENNGVVTFIPEGMTLQKVTRRIFERDALTRQNPDLIPLLSNEIWAYVFQIKPHQILEEEIRKVGGVILRESPTPEKSQNIDPNIYVSPTLGRILNDLFFLCPHPYRVVELAFVDYNMRGIDMNLLIEEGWVEYVNKAPVRGNVDVYFPKNRYVLTNKALLVRDGSMRIIPIDGIE